MIISACSDQSHRAVEGRTSGAPTLHNLLELSRDLPDFCSVRAIVQCWVWSRRCTHGLNWRLSARMLWLNVVAKQIYLCTIQHLQPAEPKNSVTAPPAKPKKNKQSKGLPAGRWRKIIRHLSEPLPWPQKVNWENLAELSLYPKDI